VKRNMDALSMDGVGLATKSVSCPTAKVAEIAGVTGKRERAFGGSENSQNTQVKL
jgi:hypothetical protein